MPAQKKILNRNPNRKEYAINRNAGQRAAVRKDEQQMQAKKTPTLPDRAVKWKGAICLEVESMLVEIYRDITNMRNQGDEFHNETENK